MKNLINIIKKHPVAFVIFVIYNTLCILIIRMDMVYHEQLRLYNHPELVTKAMNASLILAFGYLLNILVLIVCCVLALFKKRGSYFYVMLVLILVTESLLAIIYR